MIFKKTNAARVLNNIYFLKNEPVSLVHFVTNRCNARCSFCFIDFDNPETFKGELSLQEIDDLHFRYCKVVYKKLYYSIYLHNYKCKLA